jgi:hypothetical protein
VAVDAEGDAELLLLLDDELLLHAAAEATVSTAIAAVPYLAARNRLLVAVLVDLTCSYLLTSKSSCNPGSAAVGLRKSARA